MKQNKRRGSIIIALTAMIVVGSFAIFTDMKTNSKNADMGSIVVDTELAGTLENLAPGDTDGLILNVRNSGTIKGQVRVSLVVTVPEDEVVLYPKGSITTNIEAVSDITQDVNVYGTYDNDDMLEPGESADFNIGVNVSKDAINTLQGKGFRLDVLTEMKQRDASTWEPLRTESVEFGNEVDYKVVPGSNQIRTNEFYVKRGRQMSLSTNGFVAMMANDKVGILAGDYLDGFENPKEDLRLYSLAGAPVADSDVIDSGMVIKLEKNNKELDALTIIRKGDVNESGNSDIGDLMKLQGILYQIDATGDSVLLDSDAVRLAADIDEDGIITWNDHYILTNDLFSLVDSSKPYPGRPNLLTKPKASISFTDAGGKVLADGAKVKAGDSINMILTLDTVLGLDIMAVSPTILTDTSMFDVSIGTNIKAKALAENGDGSGELLIRVADGKFDNRSAKSGTVRPFTAGQIYSIPLTIKPTAKPGDRLEFKIDNSKKSGFVYAISDAYTFIESFSGNANSHLIVE